MILSAHGQDGRATLRSYAAHPKTQQRKTLLRRVGIADARTFRADTVRHLGSLIHDRTIGPEHGKVGPDHR
jgi:hypothetical protein